MSAAMAPPDVGLPGVPHLVFQPAVDLPTGRLLGFEALLRWTNGAGGTIPPDVLIPWAESRGRMTVLNAWVLSEACTRAARWRSDLQLAVNCSVFQLHRGEAAIAAASALERSGLNPNRLTVEVTEASVVDDQATADLNALHRLGIQLALDDVGPDWSILNKLPECVVNATKIDAVLIADLAKPEKASRAIVEAIVKLSRSLGLSTVAEAVETAEQVAVLRELGVDVAQGYFFSPPCSAKDAYVLAAKNPLPTFPLAGGDDAVPTQPAVPIPPTLPAPVGAAPTQAAVPIPPTLPAPVGAAPTPSVVPRPPNSSAPVGEVLDQPIPSRSPASVGEVPDRAPVPVMRRPLASVCAGPDQAPPSVPLGSPASDGLFPDQAPIPVGRRRLGPVGPVPDHAPISDRPRSPGQAQFHVSDTHNENTLAARDVKIDQLNEGIGRLVTAVERLNELLEPLLDSRRVLGHTSTGTTG